MIKGPEQSVEGVRRNARFIKACAMFERASRATREEVARSAHHQVVGPGTVLFEEGVTGRDWIVVVRGRVRLERGVRGGRVVSLGYRSAGDVLIEAALPEEVEARARALTMEEAEVLRIDRQLAEDLLARDPGLATAALRLALVHKRELEDRMESILFRSVEGRLAEFLLQCADRWGVQRSEGEVISAPLTHLEIAQAIGSTRETVTLTLGVLRRAGLLLAIGRKLCIVDRAALAARAS